MQPELWPRPKKVKPPPPGTRGRRTEEERAQISAMERERNRERDEQWRREEIERRESAMKNQLTRRRDGSTPTENLYNIVPWNQNTFIIGESRRLSRNPRRSSGYENRTRPLAITSQNEASSTSNPRRSSGYERRTRPLAITSQNEDSSASNPSKNDNIWLQRRPKRPRVGFDLNEGLAGALVPGHTHQPTEFRLPSLEHITSYMCKKLMEEHSDASREFHHLYEGIIERGGAEIVVKTSLSAWTPEFKALEQARFDKTTLLALAQDDATCLEGSGTYISQTIDAQDQDYFKWYGGQSINLFERVKEHKKQILKGATNSLHYWIASKEGRSTFFIRLSSIDTKFSKADREFVLTILEMVQSLALQTLPEKILKKWLPPDVPVVFKTHHLNVCNPFLQWNPRNTPARRMDDFRLILESHDPQLQEFFSERMSQKFNKKDKFQETSNGFQPLTTTEDELVDSFTTLASQLNFEDPFSIFTKTMFRSTPRSTADGPSTKSFETFRLEFETISPRKQSLVPPLGTLHGPIAVVLCEPGIRERAKLVKPMLPPDLLSLYPESITGKGIPLHAIGVWYMFPYRIFEPPTVQKKKPHKLIYPADTQTKCEIETCVEYTKTLLAECTSSYVFLSGNFVRTWLRHIYKDTLYKFEFMVGEHEMEIWLQHNGTAITRMFLPVPDLAMVRYRSSVMAAQKIDVLFNLVGALNSIPTIERHTFQGRTMLQGFFRQLQIENLSGQRFTANMIPNCFRWWYEQKLGQSLEERQEKIGDQSLLKDMHQYMLNNSAMTREKNKTSRGVDGAITKEDKAKAKETKARNVIGQRVIGQRKARTDEIPPLELRTDDFQVFVSDDILFGRPYDQQKLPGDDDEDEDEDEDNVARVTRRREYRFWSQEEKHHLAKLHEEAASWDSFRQAFPDRTDLAIRTQLVYLVKARPCRKNVQNPKIGLPIGRDRLLEMMETGYVFDPDSRAKKLSFGGHCFKWPEARARCRVWIDVVEGSHPEAWYTPAAASNCPQLQQFAFKIGEPNDLDKHRAEFYKLRVIQKKGRTIPEIREDIAFNIMDVGIGYIKRQQL